VVVLSIIAFGASPLLWYYSTVALTYAPDAAFAVLIGLCSWQAIRKRSGSWLILAAVFLAVAGGFRQTTEILLFPLWALAALYVRPRWQVLVGLVVLAAVTAMWVIPLIVLAGGPEAYFRYSRELAETISSGSTVIFQGASAFAVNGVMVLFAAAAGIGAAIILGMFALPHLPSLVRRLHMDRRVLFVLAWIGPAAAVYAFGHIGQPGYVLVALPALLLLVLGPLSHVIRKQARPMVLTAALLALLIGGNVWAFTEGRHMVSGVLSSEAPATIALRDAMMWQAPQFGMVPTDRDWRGIQALVADYQPGEVIVLTGTDVLSNFRHAAFYLPEQKVYSVAVGPGGGKFFEAVRHQSDYSIAGFNYPTVRVDVPSTARAILIVENYLAEALRTGRPIEQIRFDDGSMVHWINLDGRPESLFFEDTIVLSNVPTFEERTFGDEEAVESMAAIKLERLQEQNAGAAE
jgi:hypothetical protein